MHAYPLSASRSRDGPNHSPSSGGPLEAASNELLPATAQLLLAAFPAPASCYHMWHAQHSRVVFSKRSNCNLPIQACLQTCKVPSSPVQAKYSWPRTPLCPLVTLHKSWARKEGWFPDACRAHPLLLAMSYDEVEIEDMDWSEELNAFTYQCPCGDLFQISMVGSLPLPVYF